MRRFLLFVFAVLVAVGGYFWYTGDIGTWVARARDAVFTPPNEARLAPASGTTEEAAIKPAVAVMPYRAALPQLSASASKDRFAAWTTITKAFLADEPGARDRDVVTSLETFVNAYVVSPRRTR